MGSVLSTIEGMLGNVGRGLEVSGHNVANLSTPGYKRRVGFPQLLDDGRIRMAEGTDFAPGRTMVTDRHEDLKLESRGFFVIRSEDGVFYTRQGQFRADGEGRLVTEGGYRLQARGGGEIVVQGVWRVLEDGLVLQDGVPLAQIAIVDFTDTTHARPVGRGLFEAPEEMVFEVEAPSVRQGALEASNVTAGDEIVAVMQIMRQAEIAQRVTQTYDDLMGRALSAFGQQV